MAGQDSGSESPPWVARKFGREVEVSRAKQQRLRLPTV